MADILEFKTHLEFVGYTVEERGSGFRATHAQHLNFLFKEYRGGVLFTVMFRGSEQAKNDIPAFCAVVNEINRNLAVGRAYVDSDGDFVLEGYYPLPYLRQGLASFLEGWHGDAERAFSNERIRELLD